MNPRKMLVVLSWLALVAGLLLIFVFDGSSGWFAYAPLSEGDGFAITGGTIISNREMLGFVLIAVAATVGSGLAGYRLGARRKT